MIDRLLSLLAILTATLTFSGCSGCDRAVPSDSTPEDPVQTAVSEKRDKPYDVPAVSYPFSGSPEVKTLPEQTVQAGDRLIYSGTVTIDESQYYCPAIAVRIESGPPDKPVIEGGGSVGPKQQDGTTYGYTLTARSPIKPGSYRVSLLTFNRDNGNQIFAEIPLVVR